MNKVFEKYFPLDKSWHFIAGVLIYTLLSLLSIITTYFFGFIIPEAIKILIVVFIGFGKEWLWDRKKGGTVDEKDFLYTLLGGLCCFIIEKLTYINLEI